MLDSNGKVRIMDFSLAATGPVTGIAGTPAYMAPEQLVGGHVTAKSDIYALGLVLYELFTGKRAFEAKTIADLVVEHSSGSITSPAALVKSLDGAIERAILRCLDPDPARRPASSLAVAAALPGGDPLAAALAAGETPSPEMVAAAGGESATVTLVSGAVWLGLAALLLLAVSALADRASILTRVPLSKPPAVLLDRGEELRRSLGYPDAPVDLASGFSYDESYLNWNRRNAKGEAPWRALGEARPAALLFWIRTSPLPMASWEPMSIPDENDPPFVTAGMTRMTLDTKGRLVGFLAVPAQLDSKAPAAQATDWAPVFAAAGLDLDSFSSATPSRTPLTFADDRRAWSGALPETQIPITIEAASFHGKLVSFEIVGPWSPASREPGEEDDGPSRFGMPALILVLLVSAVVLARWNLKSGRADRRGAYRLAVVLFFDYAAFWVLLPHLSSLDQEMNRLFTYLGLGMFVGGVMYLVYLAIEPFVRRSWPTMLVGWSRVLAGRLPDPVIGRDLLIGAVAGLVLSALDLLGVVAPALMGSSQVVVPMRPELGVLEHNRYFLLTIASTLNNGLQNALLTVMMFTVLREIVKRALTRLTGKWVSPDYVAATIALAFLALLGLVNNEYGQTMVGAMAVLQVVSIGVFLLVLLRFGLLATVVMYTTNALAMRTPLTLKSAALYSGPAWVMLGVIFAIAAVGFWMARKSEAATI
jgi:serine/threonine-protein kinase